MKSLLTTLGILAVIAAYVAAKWAFHPSTVLATAPAEVQVDVKRAAKANFVLEIRVTGFLVARGDAVVTLDVPGYKVSEVLANEGDRVSSGQALVRLARQASEGPQDPRPATLTLKAPAAGVITRSTATVGATASPMQSEPLFLIAVDNEIELEADVPSIHVPQLKPGQHARAQIEKPPLLSGKVRLVPGAIDMKTQLGKVRLSLDRDPRLRVGMFAAATITADVRQDTISVPRSAVLHRTEGPIVQVVRQNVIATRGVEVGYSSETDTEIRKGIQVGELVVVKPGSSLREGDKVKPVEIDASRVGQR